MSPHVGLEMITDFATECTRMSGVDVRQASEGKGFKHARRVGYGCSGGQKLEQCMQSSGFTCTWLWFGWTCHGETSSPLYHQPDQRYRLNIDSSHRQYLRDRERASRLSVFLFALIRITWCKHS